MSLDINKVIYLYILICIALLLYNMFFIFYSKRQNKKYYEYEAMWKKIVKKQLIIIKHGGSVEQKHKDLLESRLMNMNKLISYSHVLETFRNEGENIEDYLKEVYTVIQSLAYKYKKKEVSDRAFFVFFISNNPPCDGKEYNTLMSILISYLDDSNIYYRENILKALYALGNTQAVVNAFQIINARRWFHHPKLLSDGLITFKGDKEKLAEALWDNYKIWEENIVISIIKFITLSSYQFNERLYLKLKSEETGLEVKIAIIRYFKRHEYEPVHSLLINYLSGEDSIEENIKIVAASALENYSGEKTITALKEALKDSNWYVRYNAALSLKKLNLDIDKYKDIIEGNDVYAKEMFNYVMTFNESRG